MTRPREIWFERNYSTPRVTWRAVHPHGKRARAILIGTLVTALLVAIAASLLGAGPEWFLASQGAAILVGIWFLLSIRGRITG